MVSGFNHNRPMRPIPPMPIYIPFFLALDFHAIYIRTKGLWVSSQAPKKATTYCYFLGFTYFAPLPRWVDGSVMGRPWVGAPPSTDSRLPGKLRGGAA